MKSLLEQQHAARKMRVNGISIPAIAVRLGVAKSSVSVWVKEVRLSPTQKRILRGRSYNAGRDAFSRAARERSRLSTESIARATMQGRRDVRSLSQRDSLMIGLGLYWGEGSKRGNNECAFTNTDPEALRFIMQWLYIHYRVRKEQFVLRVSINHAHRNREQIILKYWCKTLGVTMQQFTKTSFVKTKQKRTYTHRGPYYGTLRIKVSRGAPLRARILSSISVVKTRT